MAEKVSFTLGAKVRITTSGETGEVIGCAHYRYADDSFLVRYKASDGRAVERWWTESALESAQ